MKTVSKYANKFRELQLELGPHAHDEGTAIHKFLNGLHGPIRLYTSLQDPQSLEDAFRIAETCESNSRSSQIPHPKHTSNNRHNDAMELGNAQAYKRKGNPHSNNSHNHRKPTNDAWKAAATCHHCGKRGHIKPDCRSLQRQQRTNSNGGGDSVKPAGGRAKLSLAEQLANITKELAALKTSKN